MRLKPNRKHVYQKQHSFDRNQHGQGIREIAHWVLNKGKKGAVYAKKHAADILKLASVAIKLYNGDTSSVVEALKTATSVLGMDELTALKNIIRDKHDVNKSSKSTIKEVKAAIDSVPPAKPSIVASLADQIKDKPRLKPSRKNPVSSVSLMDQIKVRPALKPVSVQANLPLNAPAGSLAAMLDAIRERRKFIEPDAEQSGLGAKRILLKMAKKAMKKGHGKSADKTFENTKNYSVGGKFSDVMGGISTISGVASTIPGPHEIVTVPLTVITGLASGIAKIFGKGKSMKGGSIKDIKKMIYDRIIQARNDMKDGGYMPSLKQLAKEIVMDVMGIGSKMLENKVRSMLGSGLKMPGQNKTIRGSGILDVGIKFLTSTVLPKILKKMGLHLSKSDLHQLEMLVKETVGDKSLTVKRAIQVAKELAPHLYRLYKGRQAGTGIKLSGGRKALTSMIAREIIKSGQRDRHR
jgi:hypothetical protein